MMGKIIVDYVMVMCPLSEKRCFGVKGEVKACESVEKDKFLFISLKGAK